MTLPAAVQAIGDAAEAAAVDAGIKPGDKPTLPGAQAPTSVVDPAPVKQNKVDPDDYKERFSRYKTTTDQTISELRGMLSKAQETIAEVQKQNQELIGKINSQVTAGQSQGSSASESAEDAAYKAWFDRLPQSIKDEYTEDYLKDQYTIQTIDKAGAENEKIKQLESKIDTFSQVQKKTQSELYEEELDRAFPDDGWIKLTQEPRWAEFCNQTVSEFDTRTFGDIVKQASDSLSAKTVIQVLKKYQQALNSAIQPENQDPLMGYVTPEGGGDGGDPAREINAQTETFTLSEVNQFFKDRATSKKYSAEEANDIENRIKAAQAAGKIING